jgi:hypothetical protein
MLIRHIDRVLFLLTLLCTCASYGCLQSGDVVADISNRYIEAFLTDINIDDLLDSDCLQVKQNLPDTMPLFYTHLSSGIPWHVPNLSVVQPLKTNGDHRYQRVSFMIKPLAAKCTLKPAIALHTTRSNYLYKESIYLEQDEWKRIDLNFKDFYHVSTGLGVENDIFYSEKWTHINLFLIFIDYDNELKGINLGPVTLHRQNRLYNFF